ncbi:PilT protein domain protein [Halorubrum coriense DSM 10284]|uniref:PilT protein domain protein n=1 Tax=Halorubrum coriense DSM 10284 TaxID=1227466 RepID=M0EAH8_9EURY|nr:PIN domain-containing protein [Halorubrum coriense]ELZ43419.1 PilT protein domain protein [Halorubrum coriense DSM 10284]
MLRALIDTSVLFTAAYKRDNSHDTALPVLHGIDNGTLSEAAVLDYTLAETFNGLTTRAGHDAAVGLPDRIEETACSHMNSLTIDAFATGKSLFRQHKPLSVVDACIIAYIQTEGLGCLYAFDDDFDAVEDVYRLDTATNQYDPS